MFGQGKFQNGVLVEPAEGLSVDPNDPQQVAAFRNAIWYALLVSVWLALKLTLDCKGRLLSARTSTLLNILGYSRRYTTSISISLAAY